VHSSVTTTGPLLWGLLGLGVAACAAALLLALDAARRPPGSFAGLPETRWTYVVVGVVYAVAYAAWWFNAVRAAAPWVGHVVLFGGLAMLLTGAAYLLRVVYPKRPTTETSAPSGRADELQRHEEH